MTNQEIMVAVRAAISTGLKSPASAQFPEDNLIITGDDATGYDVRGYVDSQNSYGAMIRNDYTAKVVIANGVPVVVSKTIGVQAGKAKTKSFVANYIAISIFVAVAGAISYFVMKAMYGF